MKRFFGACLLGLSVLCGASAVSAETIAEFYKGKVVRIVVGTSAGGGYDLYARVVARHLNRLLPGAPTIIVENLPGAGGLKAANDIYNVRPQDGTVILAPQADTLFAQIAGDPGAQFDSSKFHWLGSLNQEAGIAFTWHTSKVKTFDDLLKTEAIFGSSGPNVTGQLSSVLMNMFGAKIRQVAGYESVPRMYPAVEAGEIEGMTTLWSSLAVTVPQWLKENRINKIVQFALTRQSDLPNTPLIMDLLTERYLTPGYSPAEARTIMQFLMAQQAMARPFGVGPGVPADRVEALRAAFATLVKDGEFRADAEKAKRDIDFMDGPAVQTLVQEASRTPKETLRKIAIVSSPPAK